MFIKEKESVEKLVTILLYIPLQMHIFWTRAHVFFCLITKFLQVFKRFLVTFHSRDLAVVNKLQIVEGKHNMKWMYMRNFALFCLFIEVAI